MAEVIGYANEGTFFIWHRCGEELPELYKKVLTTDKFGNVIMNMLVQTKEGEPVWVRNHTNMVAWGNVPAPYVEVAITNE